MSGRTGYHHGNLAAALTDAATALARRGGPEAVVLRAAARDAGVSAAAAYRHFAGQRDLLGTVVRRADAALAEAVRGQLAAVPASDPAGRLRAFAAGYLRFALAEPGLFRTACRQLDTPVRPLWPYQILGTGAATVTTVWATVHGFALLLLDGAAPAHLKPDRAVATIAEFITRADSDTYRNLREDTTPGTGHDEFAHSGKVCKPCPPNPPPSRRPALNR